MCKEVAEGVIYYKGAIIFGSYIFSNLRIFKFPLLI